MGDQLRRRYIQVKKRAVIADADEARAPVPAREALEAVHPAQVRGGRTNPPLAHRLLQVTYGAVGQAGPQACPDEANLRALQPSE